MQTKSLVSSVSGIIFKMLGGIFLLLGLFTVYLLFREGLFSHSSHMGDLFDLPAWQISSLNLISLAKLFLVAGFFFQLNRLVNKELGQKINFAAAGQTSHRLMIWTSAFAALTGLELLLNPAQHDPSQLTSEGLIFIFILSLAFVFYYQAKAFQKSVQLQTEVDLTI